VWVTHSCTNSHLSSYNEPAPQHVAAPTAATSVAPQYYAYHHPDGTLQLLAAQRQPQQQHQQQQPPLQQQQSAAAVVSGGFWAPAYPSFDYAAAQPPLAAGSGTGALPATSAAAGPSSVVLQGDGAPQQYILLWQPPDQGGPAPGSW
jgi:hypothetical protein